MINQVPFSDHQLTGERPQPVLSKKNLAAEGDKEHDGYKKVAKEMESLFAYQLLQIMRKTEESISGEEKGAGFNTYVGMFDMEVSKLLADRGLGMQDAIIQWLERMPEADEK